MHPLLTPLILKEISQIKCRGNNYRETLICLWNLVKLKEKVVLAPILKWIETRLEETSLKILFLSVFVCFTLPASIHWVLLARICVSSAQALWAACGVSGFHVVICWGCLGNQIGQHLNCFKACLRWSLTEWKQGHSAIALGEVFVDFFPFSFLLFCMQFSYICRNPLLEPPFHTTKISGREHCCFCE